MSLVSLNTRVLMPGLLAKPSVMIPVTALAGGGAASGVVLVETQHGYKVSNKIKEWGTYIYGIFKPSGQQGENGSGHTNGLSSVGSFFSNTYNSSSAYLSSAGSSVGESIKGIFTSSQSFDLEMLKELQKQLNASSELKDLFTNLFTNSTQFAKFGTNSEDRKVLTDLFKSNKLSKTQEALKVLAGIDKNSSFKVEEGVSVYLMKELIRDPKNVSKKIVRFVDFIDKVKTKVQGNTSSGSDSSTGTSTTPYTFTKQKLQGFLTERKEASQDGGELGFLLEVGAKQKGVDLGPLPSSAFSAVFDFLDIFSKPQTTAPSKK